MDGNFSAEHMKMSHPERDVYLSDGLAYMVQWAPYKQHLDHSAVTKEVSPVQECIDNKYSI